MKKLIAATLAIAASCACAATSTVTATVTDTDGQVWSNGTWTAMIVMPGGPFSNMKPTIGGALVTAAARGSLDANGAWTASLTDTSSLDQAGVQWTIRVCPNASVSPYGTTDCAVYTGPIVGPSVNLTSKFSNVTAPRFPAGLGAFGYSDAEVFPPSVVGSSYFNTSTDSSLTGLRLWDGQRWIASSGAGGGSAGGDLSGAYPNPRVARVNGVSYSSTAPTNTSMVPVWNGSTMSPRQLSVDDLTVAFGINSFSGGQNVEIGQTVTNPAFTAAYSYTPNSAQITNTDGISSPTALSAPFTSGTVTGSFVKTSQSSTTFTLTAIAATTKTANQSINWLPRTFGGVGNGSGATSCTASGTSCNLTGGTSSGTLASAGLNNQASYGPYSPSGQKIYIIMIGCSHTFTWNGFSFPMNAAASFTFTNQYGSAVSMCRYESVNPLNQAGVTINVAS